MRTFQWVTRSRLALVFREDPQGRLSWWAVLAIMTLGVLGGLLRTGISGTLDSAWAEDGRDFLAVSLREGPIASLFEPYAGYGHLLPRILSGIASVGPLWASSAVMAVAAVTVVGLLALVVLRASAGHVQNVWVRLLLAAFVAVQPVAAEVLVSLANLQWYLLFAAFVVLVWSGTSTTATVIGGVLCFLTAASSPFGAILLPLAVLRVLVLRTGGLGWHQRDWPVGFSFGMGHDARAGTRPRPDDVAVSVGGVVRRARPGSGRVRRAVDRRRPDRAVAGDGGHSVRHLRPAVLAGQPTRPRRDVAHPRVHRRLQPGPLPRRPSSAGSRHRGTACQRPSALPLASRY